MQSVQMGRALRDCQLALFDIRHAEFLDRCRALAVEVCREKGSVSINDIRERITVPPGCHPSVFGSVFKNKMFISVGITEAAHPEAHARLIRVYTLNLEVCHGR